MLSFIDPFRAEQSGITVLRTWQEHSWLSQRVIHPRKEKQPETMKYALIVSDPRPLTRPPPPHFPFPSLSAIQLNRKMWKESNKAKSSTVDVLVVSPSLELFNAHHHIQVALGILLDHVSHVVGFPCLLPNAETESVDKKLASLWASNFPALLPWQCYSTS